MAPNYLSEEYSADIKDEENDPDNCRFYSVKVRFVPFHPEAPGLYYWNIIDWKHITRLEDILTIIVDGWDIQLELKNRPMFIIRMSNEEALESLVTCIAGYYRLMCKWTIDLCSKFKTPSLQFLLSKPMLCHGPIG